MRGLRVAVLIIFVGIIVAAVLPCCDGVMVSPVLGQAVVEDKSVSYEFGEERISVVLLDEGEAIFNIFLRVINVGSEDITLLGFTIELTDCSNISVTNISAPLYPCEPEYKVRRYDTVIYVNTSIPPGETGEFLVSFTTRQVVSKIFGYFQFLFSEKFEVNVGRFVLEVWLPPGCFLYSGGIEPIVPAPTDNFTDGERLVFRWEYERIEAGDYETFIIRYLPAVADEPSLIAVFLPLQVHSMWEWWILAGGLAAMAGVTLEVFISRRKGRRVSEVILPLLSDAEREVLKLLSASGGVMSQKEIEKSTGFSKAKVSVTLKSLEKKGLVEKEAKGRTKIVRLTSKVKV
ncbi:MAG: MarR family transcriptional regulator [Nitrososphaerota archaeon]